MIPLGLLKGRLFVAWTSCVRAHQKAQADVLPSLSHARADKAAAGVVVDAVVIGGTDVKGDLVGARRQFLGVDAVSYTHLTLPTIYSV